MVEHDHISPFEDILSDVNYHKAHRDAGYDRLMKPVWHILIRACVILFLWGLILITGSVYFGISSPENIAIFIIASLMLTTFGGTGIYFLSSLLGLIPFKQYSYTQRLYFWMAVGVLIAELSAIALLIALTSMTVGGVVD
jgi:hypothetical protein